MRLQCSNRCVSPFTRSILKHRPIRQCGGDREEGVGLVTDHCRGCGSRWADVINSKARDNPSTRPSARAALISAATLPACSALSCASAISSLSCNFSISLPFFLASARQTKRVLGVIAESAYAKLMKKQIFTYTSSTTALNPPRCCSQ